MMRPGKTLLLTLALASSPRLAEGRSRAPVPQSDLAATPAARSLSSAEAKWQALKTDAKRSRLRCNWLKVVGQLDHVAERYPHSPEAPQALLDSAQAYEDLAHVSFIADDYQKAASAYQKVTGGFPRTTESETAHQALAHLYRQKLHQEDKAHAEVLALAKERHKHRGSKDTNKEPSGVVSAPSAHNAVARNQAAPEPARAAGSRAVADAEPSPADHLAGSGATEPHPIIVSPPVAPASVAHAPPVAAALAAPIVSPEATEGFRDVAPAGSDAGAAVVADAQLFKPSEIVTSRAEREHLDKEKLAALRSAVRTSADLPLSAQMGLKVRRVVIDAGHGGHDTGAIGPTGVKEKDVSLAVAKRLADKLRQQGLDVMLTRTDDHFISLEGRTAFANDNRADLFVSVHCNSGTEPVWHGVETYSLNVSSSQYAMRLAARENASSARSISDLQYLLADLTTKANTADSRHLAHLVQSSVVSGLRQKYESVRDLGTKEALFYVLMGTRMPSILVEGSFISNPTEEHRLGDAAYQDQLAGSIAAGIARFVDERQSLGGLPVAGLP